MNNKEITYKGQFEIKFMICVDCKDVLPIQHDLLVYVADDLEAFPVIKQNEFLLSPIENNDKIEDCKVTKSVQNYLDSIGEGNNFEVVSQYDKVLIKSINGKKINRVTPPVKSLRTCCGI